MRWVSTNQAYLLNARAICSTYLLSVWRAARAQARFAADPAPMRAATLAELAAAAPFSARSPLALLRWAAGRLRSAGLRAAWLVSDRGPVVALAAVLAFKALEWWMLEGRQAAAATASRHPGIVLDTGAGGGNGDAAIVIPPPAPPNVCSRHHIIYL